MKRGLLLIFPIRRALIEAVAVAVTLPPSAGGCPPALTLRIIGANVVL